jgi:peptidoglycan/xylan/chitin deacetylase (PgdA/CDA1 family)
VQAVGARRTFSPRSPRRRRARWILATAPLAAGAPFGIQAALATGKPAIAIRIDGRELTVGRGTSVGDAVRRLGLRPRAADLLDVEGDVLRSGGVPGRLLVNGRPAPASFRLRPGDELGARDAVSRTERLTREVVPASVDRPANPQYVVDRVVGRSIVVRGAVSHKLVSARFVPDRAPFPDRAVALTFDDGPSQYTEAILSVLWRANVPATFFVVGTQARLYPELVREEVAAGMAVGDHTYDHPILHPFADLPRPEIESEVDRGRELLRRLGVRPVLFRPPGGTVSSTVIRAAAARGMRVVIRSVDARDWVARTTANQIVGRVLSQVRAGSIILMHDGGGDRSATLRALPRIIAGIRARELRFVPLAPTG